MHRDAASSVPVLVLGTLGIDTVETPFGRAEEVLGGAAAYAAIAASLFTEARVVAVVGEDFPPAFGDLLTSRGIDLAGVLHAPGATFRWEGAYSYDMAHAETRTRLLNAQAEYSPVVPTAWADTPVVFLGSTDPAHQRAVLDATPGRRYVLMDTRDSWITSHPDDVRAVMRDVDAVTLNDAELRQLCRTPSLLAGARELLASGPSLVIIKKGEHGILALTANDVFAVPGFPVEEVRDPTGAGDTFAGGVVGYLARAGDFGPDALRRAIVYGSVLASYTIEDFSVARLVDLEPGEVMLRYSEMRRLTAFGD